MAGTEACALRILDVNAPYSKTEASFRALYFSFIVVGILLAITWLRKRFSGSSYARKVCWSTEAEISALLDPPQTPIDQLLAARAIANERLIHAFDIHSTFVSADPLVRKSTRNQASLVIAAANRRGMEDLQKVASTAIHQYLPSQSIPFDTFVQAVTFHLVAVSLLGAASESLVLTDVITVTNGINTLWQLSKTSSPPPRALLDEINSHLSRWIPDRTNPLELVIPAWEGMWRVIATAVAHAASDETISHAFTTFHISPTEAQFRAFEAEYPSVEAVITEVLRLYPPSRHITRAIPNVFPLPSFLPHPIAGTLRSWLEKGSHIEVADIETAQRIGYGETGATFDPMRYRPSEGNDGCPKILAFSKGRLSCLASNWAPQVAAIVSAAILDQVDGRGHKLLSGPRIGGREGWVGWVIEHNAA